jgi:hypothetical protein
MIGVQVNKADLNTKAGDIASWLNEYFNQALEVKGFLDSVGKPGLVGLGFTEAEADIMISAFSDLETAKTSFDASAFIKQLYGLGIR